jgi:hypothetical protein
MKKRSVTIITIILTMAVVASFAVGPAVNPNIPANRPLAYAGEHYSPLASAIDEHYEILKNGTDAKISGTIENIIYGNGKMPTEITIKGDDGKEYEVELGPIWMFNATQLVLNAKISVQGKELDSKIVAFSVTFANNQLVQLRNNEGIPVWAGRDGVRRANINGIRERVENYIRTHRFQGQDVKPPMGRPPYGQNRR